MEFSAATKFAVPKVPSVDDYRFRSTLVGAFPLYFFVAACAVEPKGVHPLKWFEGYRDRDDNIVRHPCYAYGPVPKSQTYPGVPLRLAADASLVHQYQYFLKLRTATAWHIPLPFSYMPQKPSASATPEQRGQYGLFLMLLFRPWRGLDSVDFLTAALAHEPQCSTAADAWARVYTVYESWRLQVEDRALPFFQRPRHAESPRPGFGTDEWWACMIWLRLRHMELVLSSHHRFGDEQPPDVSMLAPSTGGTDPFDADPSAGPDEFDVQMQGADGDWHSFDDSFHRSDVLELPEEPAPPRPATRFAALTSRPCAPLPGDGQAR